MIDNLTNNPRKREPLHTQWWVPFVRWLDGPMTPVLLKKFLSTLEKNVAYENPFYQENKE